jgi:sugar transferase (PEP-CTERM/EpsH1 system associated)
MHVVLNLRCGGLEKLTIDLASRLNDIGCNSIICCLESGGELAETAKNKGVKIISCDKRHGIDVSAIWKLYRILKKNRIEAVHTHNMAPLIYGTISARLAGIPVVINTRHGPDDKAKNRSVYRLIWSMNDSIIAVSEDVKRQLLSNNQIGDDRIKVIHNGIDLDKCIKNTDIKAKRRSLGINNESLVIGATSRLCEKKDQMTLLNAFSLVEKKVNNAILVFVGDGPLRVSLEQHSIRLGMRNKVLFLGFMEDVETIVQVFDVFALSSLAEGVSLCILEAMAAGKPVVATKIGGNPEVVVDGETGILVPPKDASVMADAIIKLLNDAELRERMGAAGRRRVEEKFSLDRMVREYESIYEECLKPANPLTRKRAN